MNRYSKSELFNIVTTLLSKGHEGEYWDYKKEWPDSIDLLKDIISFANTLHCNDCFLIIGAEDNGTPYVMQNRRNNQNQLNNLLSSPKLKWAGDNQPEVSLETITINENQYDIIIVYNSDRTPFYLQADYEVRSKQKPKTLYKGVIYTRTGDSTTGFDKMANPYTVENLWKKRFHLLQPIYTQFIEEMKCPDSWEKGDGDSFSFHHIYRPEFTFQDKPEEQRTRFEEYYTWLFPDKSAYRNIFQCKYFGTVLREFYFISMDGGRWYCPYPKIDTLPFPFMEKRYFYFLITSDEMIIYNFLERGNMCSYDPFRRLSHYIPMFLDQNEQSAFICWLQDKQERFETECSKIKPERSFFKRDSFAEDAIVGKAIVNLFNEFRQESSSGIDTQTKE